MSWVVHQNSVVKGVKLVPQNPPRVFVSSMFQDLTTHRQAVADAILELAAC